MAITPSILKATEGLINGQGLDVNSTMLALFETYQAQPIPVTITSLLPYTSNVTGLSDAINTLQPYLRGSGNIINIKNQANAILPNSVSGTITSAGVNKFISVFSQSLGFVGTSAEFKKASGKLGNKSYSELGPGITKFSDVASGGISSAFGNIANLKLVANAVSNWGTAYDVSGIGKLHNYGTFIANLQKQGLGNVGDLETKLVEAGVDTTDLENANQEQLKSILKTITGSELQKVISQTGVVLASTPTDLSQLLDSAVVLNKATRQVIPGKPESTYVDPGNGTKTVYPSIPAGSFEALGTTIDSIGGSFKTFTDLGNFLNSVQSTSSPTLDAAMASPATTTGVDTGVGLGHGPDGACILADVIGSLSGYVYNKEFSIINPIVVTTSGIPTAQTVATEAANVVSTVATYGSTDPNVTIAVTAFSSAISNYNSALTSTYSKDVAIANSAMANVYTQYTLETTNLGKAGIVLSDPPPTGTAGILNFGKALHTYGVDKSNLGTYEFLSNVADSSVIGESIKSALIEGKNLDAQSQAGVTTGTS